jgi:hypothetical protein
MKKNIAIIISLITIGCSSIGYTEGITNEAYIEKIIMPTDSSNVYLIQWKEHLFLYDRSQTPNVIEIDYIK